MLSCLGIHIEDYTIEYAKVSKEKNSLKVDAVNVVFYEDLKSTLKQIITETNSLRIPISINASGEMYNYFQESTLLSKQDLKKATAIDFDLICQERNYNKDTLETRFLYAPSLDNEENTQVIAISASQADLYQKKAEFDNIRIGYMHPISTSILNVVDPNENGNIAIVNIEEQTKVTLVVNGQVVKVEMVGDGMRDIINKINSIENSVQKSYEVCKNTTIYDQETGASVSEGNEYIESIMPTLYSIVNKTKDIIEDSEINISKIYITGLGTSINNVDLYFQEYFDNIKCELLKPFFANDSSNNNSVKEYVEVNSAIALALNGLGYGYKEVNFADPKAAGSNIKGIVNSSVKMPTLDSFSKKFDAIEKLTCRIMFVCLVCALGYIISSTVISKNIDSKVKEVEDATALVDAQISKATTDLNKITEETNKYQKAIDEMNALDQNQGEIKRYIRKCAIPHLLYALAEITPKRVQILSMENNKDSDHIVIKAQSQTYEQLGYLKAALSTGGYLLNVKSTSGTKTKGWVNAVIEGDLP